MKSTALIAVSFSFLTLATVPVKAAEMNDMTHMHHAMESKADAAQSATAQVHKGQATVNRVDENASKINVAHEAIPSLNWPAMTMDLQVKDKSVLKGVAPGQKVTLDIEQQGPGKFVVSRIVPTGAGTH